MSNGAKAYNVRDISFHGKPEMGQCVVNPGKVLPATATGNLFSVTGTVIVTGLVGVVSTALSITAVHISIGVTNLNTAIAANPVATFASTVVGSVIIMPPTIGAALPAAVSAQTAVAASTLLIVNGAVAPNITITTDATNTGAITWLLTYASMYPKNGVGAVAAV